MIETILKFVWEFVIYWLCSIFWWLVLFPVVWLMSLPFILVFATVRPEPYCEAVFDMFASVHQFWRDNGFWWCAS